MVSALAVCATASMKKTNPRNLARASMASSECGVRRAVGIPTLRPARRECYAQVKLSGCDFFGSIAKQGRRAPPQKTATSLGPLHDHRDPLAAADAGRRHAELLLPLLQLEQQRIDEPSARGAERMAQADRAAVHVELVAIDLQLLLDRQDLTRERLVDLEQVEL